MIGETPLLQAGPSVQLESWRSRELSGHHNFPDVAGEPKDRDLSTNIHSSAAFLVTGETSEGMCQRTQASLAAARHRTRSVPPLSIPRLCMIVIWLPCLLEIAALTWHTGPCGDSGSAERERWPRRVVSLARSCLSTLNYHVH